MLSFSKILVKLENGLSLSSGFRCCQTTNSEYCSQVLFDYALFMAFELEISGNGKVCFWFLFDQSCEKTRSQCEYFAQVKKSTCTFISLL